MEQEWMRSMVTVIAFVTFIGIVLWAWSGHKRSDFDRAARSVLTDDDAVSPEEGFVTANNNQGRQQ